MKKGDNSEKKQKFKKRKYTILRYLHIGIYVKISDYSVLKNNWQTHKQTKKHTYWVKAEENVGLFFYYREVFIFYFSISNIVWKFKNVISKEKEKEKGEGKDKEKANCMSEYVSRLYFPENVRYFYPLYLTCFSD